MDTKDNQEEESLTLRDWWEWFERNKRHIFLESLQLLLILFLVNIILQNSCNICVTRSTPEKQDFACNVIQRQRLFENDILNNGTFNPISNIYGWNTSNEHE